MPASPQLRLLKTATALSRGVPHRALQTMATSAASVLPRLKPAMATELRFNLAHIVPEASEADLDQLVAKVFGAYGRYWADTLALPKMTAAAVDEGFSVDGYEHIVNARSAGLGPIMVLPHLGGWEWAAAWLGRVAQTPVTAVVERLEPSDVFDWFTQLRSSYGINVVPLGPDAISRLLKAVRDNHVVCLLGDRDIGGNGIEVEFFGAATKLPAGPALLARRSGAPLLPTAVYFQGAKCHCRILEPIVVDRTTRLRQAVTVATQEVARQLEVLIAEEPGQWHVLQAAWPAAELSKGPVVEPAP